MLKGLGFYTSIQGNVFLQYTIACISLNLTSVWRADVTAQCLFLVMSVNKIRIFGGGEALLPDILFAQEIEVSFPRLFYLTEFKFRVQQIYHPFMIRVFSSASAQLLLYKSLTKRILEHGWLVRVAHRKTRALCYSYDNCSDPSHKWVEVL